MFPRLLVQTPVRFTSFASDEVAYWRSTLGVRRHWQEDFGVHSNLPTSHPKARLQASASSPTSDSSTHSQPNCNLIQNLQRISGVSTILHLHDEFLKMKCCWQRAGQCQAAGFDIGLIWNYRRAEWTLRQKCELLPQWCKCTFLIFPPQNTSRFFRISEDPFSAPEYLSVGSPANWARRESVGVLQERKDQPKYLPRCPPVSMRVAPLQSAIAFPMTNPKNRKRLLKYPGS